ncbi:MULTISPECIES: winged helix DNA-binding protein [Sphingomonadaceae]|uniref:winged helix DNA-binding protein n=1 Tax=Sphingomonadales TaxID=204457 RepID=UPI001CCD718D|nr:winged helix DNA-binding protein [Sphingobium sp. 3R8]MBA4091530.1 MarR family transcriptional regulator [Sphingobium sp.]MBZ9647555.1 winged helix DNA-binding protein [Sphingobium sp. 3R8]
MMEDFSYAHPLTGQATPLAPRDERASLLVIADRMDAPDLAPVAAAAGFRLLGVTALADAPVRLDLQAQCDTVLFFCPAMTPLLERLLVQLETQAIQNGMAVILVAGWETVELAFACLRGPHTQLLCDPDRTELAAALVAAGEHRPVVGHVHEVDREGARLQQLSEEVGRLARTLDALTERTRMATPSFDLGPRISDRPSDYIGMPALAPIGATVGSLAQTAEKAAPAITAAQVRDLLRARRIRADFLPGDLFADPAWDMMLDLLAARLDHERVSVSSLCIAAAVPPTTALRWIRTLTDKGLVERHADPHDGRRVFIALAQEAADALTRWFGASRRLLGA